MLPKSTFVDPERLQGLRLWINHLQDDLVDLRLAEPADKQLVELVIAAEHFRTALAAYLLFRRGHSIIPMLAKAEMRRVNESSISPGLN